MKPQQDKFVKDKLLNEIFQEIADENTATDETPYQEEKSTDDSKELSKKRKLQTIRLRIIIVLLVLLILYVLFNPKEETDTLNLQDPKENIYSIPIANQIPTVEELREEALAKKEPLIKISEKEMIINTKIIPEAEIKNTQTLNIQEPKAVREKAKNQLMQQMQN
ncbi:MAG: hypothetical protein COB07_03125 [Sulfurovum sp.]|nr:MAG: hypothetical protein COB07_03125 [Sulfurovum sp.]